MKNSVKLATTVALLAAVGGLLSPPANAIDFASILQNLSHGVSGWSELDMRENEISAQLGTAAASGQLTAAEADGFKLELARVQQVEAQIKASRKSLGATDSISFTNSLNNLTNRINIAITTKMTANATNLAAVELDRAQLSQQLADARAARTITRTDADYIKRDLDHNASIQSAFSSSGDGAVTARQAQILTDDLARIKVTLAQHLTLAQAGVPQLASQRVAIEKMIAAGLSSGTIRDYQATDFRRELSRIANMQTNFLAADGALSANEVLTVAGELDRLSSRVEYQMSIATTPDRSNDNRGYNHGGGTGYSRGDRNQRNGHSVAEIDDRQAELLTRINAAQNSRNLPRWEISKLKSEFDRIAQSEAELKATGRGRLTFDQSEKLWSDLTILDTQVKTKLSASPRRAGSYRQY
jgi:hypothetical protein